jgi:hypothetical protein
MQLTRDPSLADLLLDLSNVCSREVLGGREVSLDRMREAVKVFERWSGIADARVFAVADNSLFTRLRAPADRRVLREYVDSGLVEAVPSADERLLDVIELTGGLLMTWDRFEGHRDSYPWLQGDAEHFLLVQRKEGVLAIALRDMGVISMRRVSERAEIDALKAAHLLDAKGHPDEAVLRRWWLCPERACSLFSTDRSRGQPIPMRVRGELTCSLHRLPLADGGPRPHRMQLKVLVDGHVLERVAVEEDGPVLTIGRGSTADVDVAPFLGEARQDLISRNHVLIWMHDGTLHFRDEGSTNGTKLVTKQVAEATVRGRDYTASPPQGILLADVVRIEISGRRFPSLTYRATRPRGGQGAGATRIK